MSHLNEMAAFIERAKFSDIPSSDLDRLKLHVLDTLGCAIGALRGEPVIKARQVIDRLGGNGQCTLIGGGKNSLPHAAFFNGVLVRYLDFMDTYLAEHGECHPSDTFASVLAAAEFADKSGKDFIEALAIAYQMICRFSHDTKVMQQGFDHTMTITFAMAGGAAKLLGLHGDTLVNALAIAGADAAGLMANRTEPISNWKGMATGEAAYRAMFCVLLAQSGITGPHQLFEGPGGLVEMTRDPWKIDWQNEQLDIINEVMIKKYNGEARSQSAIDALLKLRAEHSIRPQSVAKIRIDTFRAAYDNLGGGKYGPKDKALTKEQADHNLKYMAAVALIDGDLWREQYAKDRLLRADVQSLMTKVDVEPKLTYTWRDPQEQPTRVTIQLTDGDEYVHEQSDFEGFPTRPLSWEKAIKKFKRLTSGFVEEQISERIIQAVKGIENIRVQELTSLLSLSPAP